MSFDAVGVGALNIDMLFEIKPEQLVLLNEELETKKIRPFVIGNEDSGKPSEFEKTIEILDEYVRNNYARSIGNSLGGSATRTMVDLSRMGFNTGFFGLVGYDNHFLENSLRKEGVDPMIFVGNLGSGVCISISDGRDRTLRVYPNSNDLFEHRHLTDSYFGNLSKSEIIHMTSFACSLGYGPLYAQIKIAEELGENVRISFSPDELYTRLGLKMLEPILKNTYILFLSRNNMQILTGEDYKEGSKSLSKLGLLYVVTTLGGEGSYLKSPSNELLVEPVKISENEIMSERFTGIGDSFAAGVLAGLLKERSIQECMYLGSKTAEMKLRGLEREAYQNIIL